LAYEVVFPSDRVERIFQKALRRVPTEYQSAIVRGIRSLGENPRPQGKRIKKLRGQLNLSEFTAQYRLRVGPYRILYDIDDPRKKVILPRLVKRDERTYKT
jgi:mRNA-degrading endonuclease RelE of RelBE toxin-antitoxin system